MCFQALGNSRNSLLSRMVILVSCSGLSLARIRHHEGEDGRNVCHEWMRAREVQ